MLRKKKKIERDPICLEIALGQLSTSLSLDQDKILEIFVQSIEEKFNAYYNATHKCVYKDNKFQIYRLNIDDKGTALLLDNKLFSNVLMTEVRTCISSKIYNIKQSAKVECLDHYVNCIVIGKIRHIAEKHIIIYALDSLFRVTPRDFMPSDQIELGLELKFILTKKTRLEKKDFYNLSRNSIQFILGVIKENIPEIHNNRVIVMHCHRNPGIYSTIYVSCKDINVYDKLLGNGGIRIDSINADLGGEKVKFVNVKDNVYSNIMNLFNIKEEESNNYLVYEDTEKIIVYTSDEAVYGRAMKNEDTRKSISKVYYKKFYIYSTHNMEGHRAKMFKELFAMDESVVSNIIDQFITIKELFEVKPSVLYKEYMIGKSDINVFLMILLKHINAYSSDNVKLINNEDISILEFQERYQNNK